MKPDQPQPGPIDRAYAPARSNVACVLQFETRFRESRFSSSRFRESCYRGAHCRESRFEARGLVGVRGAVVNVGSEKILSRGAAIRSHDSTVQRRLAIEKKAQQ